MPKAGRYDYPIRDLDTCVEYMRKANAKTKEFSISRQTFAESIGQSHKTGPFGMLMGSISQYGLADTVDGQVRYTDRAKKILFGEASEVAAGKQQAVRKITLFADIHAKFGANVTDEQLRLYLRDIAGVDVAEAPEKALEVSKIYKKVASYLEVAPAAGDQQPPKGVEENKNMNENLSDAGLTIQPDVEHYKLGSGIQITLPKEIDKAVEAWLRVKPAMDMILKVPPQKSEKQDTSE